MLAGGETSLQVNALSLGLSLVLALKHTREDGQGHDVIKAKVKTFHYIHLSDTRLIYNIV